MPTAACQIAAGCELPLPLPLPPTRCVPLMLLPVQAATTCQDAPLRQHCVNVTA